MLHIVYKLPQLYVLFQIYFCFPIFEKYNSKNGELSSRVIHSGTSHCPAMDLAGTRDISFHSGTVPGNPGHLVTLVYSKNAHVGRASSRSRGRVVRKQSTIISETQLATHVY